MLRLVLDTNIVLDLLHFRDPSALPILRALHAAAAECFTSGPCCTELARVLGYAQFGIDTDAAHRIQTEYDALAQRVDTAGVAALAPLPQCSDADDQKFLELARCAAADFLVTKDKALLALARRKRLGFRIVKPADAAAALEGVAR